MENLELWKMQEKQKVMQLALWQCPPAISMAMALWMLAKASLLVRVA